MAELQPCPVFHVYGTRPNKIVDLHQYIRGNRLIGPITRRLSRMQMETNMLSRIILSPPPPIFVKGSSCSFFSLFIIVISVIELITLIVNLSLTNVDICLPFDACEQRLLIRNHFTKFQNVIEYANQNNQLLPTTSYYACSSLFHWFYQPNMHTSINPCQYNGCVCTCHISERFSQL